MSILSGIVGKLESNNGANAAAQPASMVDKTYGQYSGFTNQYGSGAAGVDNYANQMLAANPDATLGDFYSSYVLGTGNPASISTTQDLQSRYPSAYQNLADNSGYSLSTPLSSLVTPGTNLSDGGFGSTADFTGSTGGSGSTGDGYTFSGFPGVTTYFPGDGSAPTTSTPGSVVTGNNVTTPLSSTSDWWQTFINDIGNVAMRGGIVLLGIGLVIVAAYMAMNGELGSTAQKVAQGMLSS